MISVRSFLLLSILVSNTLSPAAGIFDVIIRGGTVYTDGHSDGTVTDVGILGDRVATVGDLAAAHAALFINAEGMLVVPGFIDTHTHADRGGHLEAYLRQGVTTIVAGNCGGSPDIETLGEHYASLEGELGPNYIGLIGHNRLRANVCLSGAVPTRDQMERMKALIGVGMGAGAFGLSTGLTYSSGFNSTTIELIELASEVTVYNGVYTTHMRSEGAAVLEALDEAITIGRETGIPVLISHAKCAGPVVWGSAPEFLARIDAANAEGLEVRFDQYPYTASQTTINVLFPPWAQQGWRETVVERRADVEAGVAELLAGRGGADRVYLVAGDYSGMFLSEAAALEAVDPVALLIDRIGPGGARAVYHMMDEEDVRTFMAHPMGMVGSDGPSATHPRGWGSFPRFWGHYGRDLEMFDDKESVRKTSTLAAEQFRLFERGRGRIAPGYFADITVLDPNTIIDRATFDAPTLTPLGVEYVLVNGEAAVISGEPTASRPGRVLKFTDNLLTHR